MNFLQLFRCATGHHARSARRSRIVDGRRESVCRGCGRKMIKESFTWELIGSADSGENSTEG